jgi:rhamnogalacturonan endolyase
MKHPIISRRTAAHYLGLAALCTLAGCGSGDSPANLQATAPRLLAATGTVSAISALSVFGVTEDTTSLAVSSGAGLVFKVNKSNGDITSFVFNNGPELQDKNKGSQISSGLGAAVSYTVSGGIVKITLTTSTLVHYLVVRQGENNIYMGTYVTAEPSVGELRWVTRLNRSILTSVPAESDLRGNTGAIESTDVYGMADGSTRSKYYGNQSAMDLTIRGVTGSGVGVFMAYGNRESSSGGPFFHDIQNQTGFPETYDANGDTQVYNYMNSGHNQTEAFRMGFHGPYALMFNDGTSTPAVPDMSWMEALGLNGWVPAAQRGKVVGRALYGFDLAHKWTVGFANTIAQYWAVANAPNGNFVVPAMKPGTYAMTVYKDEIAVYTSNVTVNSGANTTLSPITVTDPDKTAAVWRIGTWDGKPAEFLNGTTFNLRHPSDTRNASWGPTTYAVGAAFDTFPAAQWKTSANSPTRITFTLTPDQLAAHTVRIGITASYNNARPQITVNGWTSSTPAASTQPQSRSLTIGTYRGNNSMFSYAVPASAFVAGTNTLTINVASGTAGTGFLSPGLAYDALDML